MTSPASPKPNIFIIMPAYNEEARIGAVCSELVQAGYTNIIVVDDGSSDKTSAVATKYTSHVLRHPVNCGYGAALFTGIRYANAQHADIVVTFDADGQHVVADIEGVVKPLLANTAGFVLGVRTIDRKNMPLLRRWGNTVMNILTWMFFGVHVHDSHSGLRAFSRDFLSSYSLMQSEYGAASDMFRIVHQKEIMFVEVPIHTRYAQNFNVLSNTGIKRGMQILFRFFIDI